MSGEATGTGEYPTPESREAERLHDGDGCPLGDPHIGPCGECGTTTDLGWAHVCRPCWDAFIALGMEEANALD